VAATALLDDLLDQVETWVHLYTLAVALGPSTTLADLREAAWTGYFPQKATGWTPSLWNGSRADSSSDPLRWVLGVQLGPWTVVGYYVTDGQSGPLLWVEQRPQGPVELALPIDQVEVFPRLTMRQDDFSP
jgi:hypothetical protein